LHRTTSCDVLNVKIRQTGASVGLERTEKSEVLKHSKVLGVYFGYMGANPPGWIEFIFWKKISTT